MRVLVVDDSGAMRKVIMRSLHAIGITDIAEAADGVQAISVFQSSSFDLIITDWIMPEKNGVEMVADLRASGATLPILMVTTQSQNEQIAQAREAGVTDYLIKPFTNDMLRAKLEKHVTV